MAVRVRLFAAARDAAGTSEVSVEAGSLRTILDGLAGRCGPGFARVLGVATVLVDGSAVDPDDDVSVPEGAEVVILPPFSGG